MASAFLLLPFYLKYLSPSIYGELSIWLTIAIFIQTVVVYSFDNSVYIHYHEFKNQPAKLHKFLSSTFIFMLLTGGGVIVICFLLGDIFMKWIFPALHTQFYPFGLLTIITGVCQALFKVYTNLLQTGEKPSIFVTSNLLLFLIIAGTTIGGLIAFPETLIGPITGRMAAYAAGIGWVLYRVVRDFGITFDYALLKSVFNFNRYLYLYQIMQWMINYLDRFLLLFYLSSREVGIYDFAVKCVLVIELIMNGLAGAFYPRVVSTVMAQEKKHFTIELNRYYYLVTLVVMFVVCLGIFILPLMSHWVDIKKGYAESFTLLPFIAAIYLLRTMRLYFGAPFGLLKISRPLPVICLLVTLLKIGLIVLLVRQWGIPTVIIGTTAACLLDILLSRNYWYGKFDFRFNPFKLIISPLILFVVILVFEGWLGGVNQWELHLGYLILALLIFIWGYRQEIKLVTKNKLL